MYPLLFLGMGKKIDALKLLSRHQKETNLDKYCRLETILEDDKHLFLQVMGTSSFNPEHFLFPNFRDPVSQMHFFEQYVTAKDMIHVGCELQGYDAQILTNQYHYDVQAPLFLGVPTKITLTLHGRKIAPGIIHADAKVDFEQQDRKAHVFSKLVAAYLGPNIAEPYDEFDDHGGILLSDPMPVDEDDDEEIGVMPNLVFDERTNQYLNGTMDLDSSDLYDFFWGKHLYMNQAGIQQIMLNKMCFATLDDQTPILLGSMQLQQEQFIAYKPIDFSLQLTHRHTDQYAVLYSYFFDVHQPETGARMLGEGNISGRYYSNS